MTSTSGRLDMDRWLVEQNNDQEWIPLAWGFTSISAAEMFMDDLASEFGYTDMRVSKHDSDTPRRIDSIFS